MGGIFGSTTISTSDKRINSMRIQQSAYGLTQPLIYGKNRVEANMFWYGDFKATAHTTTTKSGGKGGKTKTKNTTYTYSASLMLGRRLRGTIQHGSHKRLRIVKIFNHKAPSGAFLLPKIRGRNV